MTYLPKEELIGLNIPDSINSDFMIDEGPSAYIDVQTLTAVSLISMAYLGNGIVLTGTSDGHLFRSVDYGRTWIDLGALSLSSINTIIYLKSGIVLYGDNGGHIRKSTDFGQTWATKFTAGGAILSLGYGGSANVLAGTSAFGAPAKGHIIASGGDFGETWVDLGGITVGGTDAGFIDSILFFNSALGLIVIFTDSNGVVFRSTNGGTIWTSTNTLSAGVAILVSVFVGNKIGMVANNNGDIFISKDNGVTWISPTLIITKITAPTTMVYLGNGIIFYAGNSAFVEGSRDFGNEWFDTAIPGALAFSSGAYLGNGVIVLGGSNGHIYRYDTNFTIAESQVNYPRIQTDQTANRVLWTVGTPNVYTNNDKTRSLMVNVGCVCFGGAAGGNAFFQVQADTGATPVTPVSPEVGLTPGAIAETKEFGTVGIVLPGLNYRVLSSTSGTGTVTLNRWFEMYI